MYKVQWPDISEVEFNETRHQSKSSKSPTKITTVDHQFLELLQCQAHEKYDHKTHESCHSAMVQVSSKAQPFSFSVLGCPVPGCFLNFSQTITNEAKKSNINNHSGLFVGTVGTRNFVPAASSSRGAKSPRENTPPRKRGEHPRGGTKEHTKLNGQRCVSKVGIRSRAAGSAGLQRHVS